jgi:ABC-type sugar transport system ATPase subunit
LLNEKAMCAAAVEAMRTLGVELDPLARVDTLTRAEQQMLEIVRALGGRPGALILDEPTAMLSHEEAQRLFDAVAALRSAGWAILYISHRMEEIRRLGDVVSILRDGKLTGHYRLADVSNERMISDMVGRAMESFYPTIAHRPADPAIETIGLASGDKLKDGALRLNYGEIVGLGGLVGCGKTELARAVFGLEPIDGGSVRLEGAEIKVGTPAEMLGRGIIYLPQDRRGEALALNRSVAENMSVEVLGQPDYCRWGFLKTERLAGLVSGLIGRLRVLPPNPDKQVRELSGGNQQKVVLGRALSRPRKIYIFDEPTAGVDVGARRDFYVQLQRLCEAGAAILLVTSDLQELIHMSHRIYVMHHGRCVASLESAEATEDAVVALAFGEAKGGTANTKGMH